MRILKSAAAGNIPARCTILKNEKESHTMESFSFAETGKMNRYLCVHFNLKNLGVLIALNTGLRIGEICGLKWSDVDLQRGSIMVSSSMQRVRSNSGKKTKVIIQQPKTQNSVREVPVPGFLLKLLKSVKGKKEAYLLSGESDKFVEPRNMERHFETVCKKALKRKIKFHDLRHTFATLAIGSGVDVKTVSVILGHSNIYTTLNFYKAVGFDDKRDAVLKLEKKLAKYK